MRARDQCSIFRTGGKFRPDYGLLLELHALTLSRPFLCTLDITNAIILCLGLTLLFPVLFVLVFVSKLNPSLSLVPGPKRRRKKGLVSAVRAWEQGYLFLCFLTKHNLSNNNCQVTPEGGVKFEPRCL